MRVLSLLALLMLSGCVLSLCPEQVPLTPENLLSLEEQQSVRRMQKTLDRSISHGGNVYALQVYEQGNGTYYVGFTRSSAVFPAVYGPFVGNPTDDLRCTT